MSVAEHRKRLYELLEDNTIVLSYAGIPLHSNEDDYYNFEVNSQFYYLTGLERDHMAFLAFKTKGQVMETLFIEEPQPLQERWTGKMPTIEEVQQVSQIEDVRYVEDLDALVSRYMGRYHVEHAYFDLYRCSVEDLMDYNALKAEEFQAKYPGVTMNDLHGICVGLREVKDADEIELVRKAINITRQGLDNLMANLKPGMMEYQAQADFEYMCRKLGAKKFSFGTIAASGINGCMMHYSTNDSVIEDDSLLLLDLGAKYQNYCSDISRTYPANGTFTQRQKDVYNVVLKANKEVAKTARPGMTLRELNDVAKQVLGEGLIELGLIEDVEDVGQYYMHGVSHSIGIDCHDADFAGQKIQPGWIISDEPGLYIDEEKIGIRIEDDLLITENGCEVLSKDIIKEPDEIEAFMKAHKG